MSDDKNAEMKQAADACANALVAGSNGRVGTIEYRDNVSGNPVYLVLGFAVATERDKANEMAAKMTELLHTDEQRMVVTIVDGKRVH